MLCGGFRLAGGRFVFGLLLQAQCLHLVGVLAELGDDLLLDRQHGVVEIPRFAGGGVGGGHADVLIFPGTAPGQV